MVVSQLRTFSVLDDRCSHHRARPTPRVRTGECRDLAFADMQLPLGHGEVMMGALVEARLLQRWRSSRRQVLEIAPAAAM